ncbi:serine hydrolase [Lewinella sp. JB7]|uniref:serine hydrolase domain-containing protein n=1 Tax=Lewinella sp. JB7 TaxID=2962887 RepID=UPI0020C9B0C4|nr:serine hydrolase [Lewinella sp. JB7]MCP9235181.1 serine hydrolase [Lewinella sp. JB7]
MKNALFTLLCSSLLLSAAPAGDEGWTERLFSWFTEWFSTGEALAEEVPVAAPAPFVSADILKLLTNIPSEDPTAVPFTWPYVTVDARDDLARRRRLLDQTVLLNTGAVRLPLRAGNPLRVIYPKGRRPDRFIAMARRFGPVQDIAFTEVIAPALAAAPPLPTVVVADDPAGLADVRDHWYRNLYGYPEITFVHYGDHRLVDTVPASWTTILCPLRAKESEAFVAQALFGAQALYGRLDRDAAGYASGSGRDLPQGSPGFREPELVNVDRRQLERLDQTIHRAIRYGATPGAQLAVLKNGHVIYERAYGRQQYRAGDPVRVDNLYDLASVTKAAATTLAVMKLYDEGRIDLTARVSDYLPEYRRTVPGRYTIAQLLAHHTGMQADLPIADHVFASVAAPGIDSSAFVRLSDRRWLSGAVATAIRQDLRKVNHTRRPVYRYSDVNYVLLQYVVEALTGTALDAYLEQEFYVPLGLSRLTFTPLSRHSGRDIVPTITDKWMGRGAIRGYVHDEAAAMLGGVAGHAGLFGNARDLGRLFQLLLDGGEFNGRQFIRQETVELFTARNPFNYRALGFDRLEGGYGSVVSAGASEATFGHTGFTGTCVWADPDSELVFVLLTNRIHPDPSNTKLLKMGTRSRMHRELYRALDTYGRDPA